MCRLCRHNALLTRLPDGVLLYLVQTWCDCDQSSLHLVLIQFRGTCCDMPKKVVKGTGGRKKVKHMQMLPCNSQLLIMSEFLRKSMTVKPVVLSSVGLFFTNNKPADDSLSLWERNKQMFSHISIDKSPLLVVTFIR